MKVKTTAKDSQLEVEIELDEKQSISCILTPPDGDVSFVDILPEIYTIYNKVLQSTLEEHSRNGLHTKCDKGCETCCHQLITVSIHEAILLVHLVNSLNEPERSRIKNAFDTILEKLEEKGLLKDLLDFHVNKFDDKANIINIQKEYWQLNQSCPFLVDDSCSIYPFRPFICRQYLVSSDPAYCKGSFKNDHLVKKIPLTHDFASAAASFDGEEAIFTRGIPLPTIFLINGLLTYFPRPKAPAVEMVTRFLNHVDEFFSK
ncbi:YkgJ family cysteine cluster protein [Maridesulfovibrio sp.]|uniref:YkgJ family cysteine cluster protein n=1 Tax=unclassified Maridesulfovibrio TaxID=2794999 RepID=UPI003B002768